MAPDGPQVWGGVSLGDVEPDTPAGRDGPGALVDPPPQRDFGAMAGLTGPSTVLDVGQPGNWGLVSLVRDVTEPQPMVASARDLNLVRLLRTNSGTGGEREEARRRAEAGLQAALVNAQAGPPERLAGQDLAILGRLWDASEWERRDEGRPGGYWLNEHQVYALVLAVRTGLEYEPGVREEIRRLLGSADWAARYPLGDEAQFSQILREVVDYYQDANTTHFNPQEILRLCRRISCGSKDYASSSIRQPFAALAIAPTIFADSNTNTLTANAPFPVSITVDAGKSLGELKPVWRFFGADEPNYAYMKDGQKLIGELGQLGGSQVYFRAHHLLTSGDGAYSLKFGSTSAYKEDANGQPVYDWTINDKIFDTYIARGVKPYVEIGFMPEALSTHPQDYPHNPPVNKRPMSPSNMLNEVHAYIDEIAFILGRRACP